ncbi:MAG TPA: polysaccharide deacetylase family protein, partial [Vicinamibacterales bacterium]
GFYRVTDMVLAAIALVGVLFLTHTAPFPFLLEAFRPRHSIWHMPRDAAPARIYLTFDDGPNPTATPMLLDVLERERVTATFFLIDAHLTTETAPIVRRMFVEGHAVALHSDARWLMLKSEDDLAATLTAAGDRIEQLAGFRPCPLFRPHGGWRSGRMYRGLEKIDYRLVGWSWGMWDWNWWKGRESEDLARRLSRKASPGDIIVMHDGHHVNPRADRRHVVEAASLMIPALRARGFGFGTLCDPQS